VRRDVKGGCGSCPQTFLKNWGRRKKRKEVGKKKKSRKVRVGKKRNIILSADRTKRGKTQLTFSKHGLLAGGEGKGKEATTRGTARRRMPREKGQKE